MSSPQAGTTRASAGFAPVKGSGEPVYRLCNKNGGEHHYTMDKAEQQMLVKAGWKDEGIGWYGDPNKTVGLYREYNPNAFANNHNYTTSRSEHDFLCSIGWKDESDNGKKPAWHAVAEAPKASAQALTAATISELLLQR